MVWLSSDGHLCDWCWCSHPLVLLTTMIADLLHLPYWLLMEGICKKISVCLYLPNLSFICLVYHCLRQISGLVSLSKLIGRMPVARGRTHQVLACYLMLWVFYVFNIIVLPFKNNNKIWTARRMVVYYLHNNWCDTYNLQVTTTYLLAILALKSLMQRCLHVFLFFPVVRKF